MYLKQSFLSLVLGISLFCAASCSNSTGMPGEVASVDGQGISFQDMESARALLFSARSPDAGEKLDDAALHSQYRYVLGRMIEDLVVCRYMEKNGLALAEGALAAEEKRIRDDYPDDAFDDMLLREGLNIDRWRQGLRRRLMVEYFLQHVLRPEISITSEEVQQYYAEHSEEFTILEQWHFLQVSGKDKKAVEDALRALVAEKSAAAVQKEFIVSIHDISMGKDLLPENLVRALGPLKPMQATKVTQEGQDYRAMFLLEKRAASMLDPAEISRRVEAALSEEKMRTIYAAWLQREMDRSVIRIAPALVADFQGNGNGGNAPENGGTLPVPGVNGSVSNAANATLPFAGGGNETLSVPGTINATTPALDADQAAQPSDADKG